MFQYGSKNSLLLWTLTGSIIALGITWWRVELYSLEQDRLTTEVATSTLPAKKSHSTTATTSTALDTLARKTYRNDKYGFQFQYPVDWQVKPLERSIIEGDKILTIWPQKMLDIQGGDGACASLSPTLSAQLKNGLEQGIGPGDFLRDWKEQFPGIEIAKIKSSEHGIPYALGIDTCGGLVDLNDQADRLRYRGLFYIGDVEVQIYMQFGSSELAGVSFGKLSGLAQAIFNGKTDRELLKNRWADFEKFLASVATNPASSSPISKASCEARGGTWGYFGLGAHEECNLPTTDAGKICSDMSECQGACIATLSKEEQAQVNGGATIKKKGACSAETLVVGCKAYVEGGAVHGILCKD